MNKRKHGNSIEGIVAYALEQRGFEIVTRNAYTPFGEIDIAAQRNGRLHIVEVKYRSSALYGTVAQALSYTKYKRLKRSVEYLQLHGGLARKLVQYDYCAVTRKPNGEYMIEMYANVSAQDFA